LARASTSSTGGAKGPDFWHASEDGEEPTPPDSPLLKLDNVVLTAHLAGPTFESNITRLRNGFDNVQRVARGEPALWVVPELLA
jgi:lactate dehydrogenase-like 2-hydroxyacid dehydrogenase